MKSTKKICIPRDSEPLAYTFKEKRDQWLNVLTGKDRHSIIHQVIQFTWDAVSFHMVNEARRLVPPDPDGGVKLNGLMHSLLDRGFFTLQMVAIRRLTDSYCLEGEKGVYSLTGLLKDMQAHHKLFTRKEIFESEGLEYDYEFVKMQCQAYLNERMSAGEKGVHVPKNLWWQDYERRHIIIDYLSGVTPINRHLEDTIQEKIFINLYNKLKSACDNIYKYVNKFIAHAATPGSRETARADEMDVTLNHLWESHRNLCEVTRFLAVEILGDSCSSFLPIPTYNQLRYMDQPLISPSQEEILRNIWREYDKKCQSWFQWGLTGYQQEFNSLNQ